MRREGLTVTMIFLAESANYGEGVGNITTLKKNVAGKLRAVFLYFQTGTPLQYCQSAELGQYAG